MKKKAFCTTLVGGWMRQPIWKNVRTVKLDHETPIFRMHIPKNIWVATSQIHFIMFFSEAGASSFSALLQSKEHQVTLVRWKMDDKHQNVGVCTDIYPSWEGWFLLTLLNFEVKIFFCGKNPQIGSWIQESLLVKLLSQNECETSAKCDIEFLMIQRRNSNTEVSWDNQNKKTFCHLLLTNTFVLVNLFSIKTCRTTYPAPKPFDLNHDWLSPPSSPSQVSNAVRMRCFPWRITDALLGLNHPLRLAVGDGLEFLNLWRKSKKTYLKKRSWTCLTAFGHLYMGVFWDSGHKKAGGCFCFITWPPPLQKTYEVKNIFLESIWNLIPSASDFSRASKFKTESPPFSDGCPPGPKSGWP